MRTKLFCCAAITFAFGLATTLKADNIELSTSRTGFWGNDSLDWGQLGIHNQNVAATFSATSTGGLSITGSEASGHVREYVETAVCCALWNGNFATGDNVLYTGVAGGFTGSGPLTLLFAGPISGVGTQIQSDGYGAYTAELDAYNGATLLGSVTEGGVSTTNFGDDSAIFIGIDDTTGADITKVVISLTSSPAGTTLGDFAINQLSLIDGPAAVPEPSSLLLLLTVLLLLRLTVNVAARRKGRVRP
jgi:hypothetical protein